MPSVKIPANIRFDCIRCGNCCKGWPIGLTQDEYSRLYHYAWKRVEPQLAARPLFLTRSHLGRLRQATTALADNGDCVFLGEDNVCLVHKRLGYRGKPLGCRLYPFTITRTPTDAFVGVRFSCPAVARGQGRPLLDWHNEIAALCSEMHPPGQSDAPQGYVAFSRRAPRVPWRDVLVVDRAIEQALDMSEQALGQRLRLVERLVEQFAQADMSKLSGEGLSEACQLLVPAFAKEAGTEQAQQLKSFDRPLMSQFFGFVHTRTLADFLTSTRCARIATRWRLFRKRASFAALKGQLEWAELPEPVAVGEVWSAEELPLRQAAAEVLWRYLRVKHFSKVAMGEPFGAYPYLYGVRLNVAFLAAAAWFAKARALARGADSIEFEDAVAALEHVDASYFARAGAASPAARARALCTHHGATIARVAGELVGVK